MEVVLSETAMTALIAIPSRADAKAVAGRLAMLADFPGMGAPYDPEYPAARPNHAVLVTYAGHMGIYYTLEPVGQDGGRVLVEWIEDQRSDPMGRFGS